MTELKHLRIAVAAADCGSFSSSALRLNVEISAVSRAIRDLEEAVGIAIFERLPRGVRVTHAGAAYLASARDILKRMDQADQDARAAGAGRFAELSVDTSLA